jgi:hypothetical protein
MDGLLIPWLPINLHAIVEALENRFVHVFQRPSLVKHVRDYDDDLFVGFWGPSTRVGHM